MGTENFTDSLSRKVWENNKGANVMTVTTILSTGEYKVNILEKELNENEKEERVVAEFIRRED